MYTPLFLTLLLQVFLVGMLIGTFRTVLPVIAEIEFSVSQNSLLFVTSIVLIFGVIKALSNLAAGISSEVTGRKKILILGWLLAIPIPILLMNVQSWVCIVLALVFLGVNQGLTWSMTQSAKMDITPHSRRGHAMGLNEFSGYVGVALAGFITGIAAEHISPVITISVFSGGVIILGLLNACVGIRETKFDQNSQSYSTQTQKKGHQLTLFELVISVSWEDKKMMAVCQAGLVEKFVDALVWVFFPLYFFQKGFDLAEIGFIVAVYGVVWGGMQLLTGKLSDRVGRGGPIVGGMLLCAFGVVLILAGEGLVYWSACSALIGVGMALLYPNLSAAIADLAHPAYHASTLGIYRFWRDFGYSVAGLFFTLISLTSARVTDGFIMVSVAMTASASVVAIYYHPNSLRKVHK